jgi:hypothetical protein
MPLTCPRVPACRERGGRSPRRARRFSAGLEDRAAVRCSGLFGGFTTADPLNLAKTASHCRSRTDAAEEWSAQRGSRRGENGERGACGGVSQEYVRVTTAQTNHCDGRHVPSTAPTAARWRSRTAKLRLRHRERTTTLSERLRRLTQDACREWCCAGRVLALA